MSDRVIMFKKLKKEALLKHIDGLKEQLDDARTALAEMEEEGLTDEDAELDSLTSVVDRCSFYEPKN